LLACSVLLLTACGPVGDGDDSGTSGSGGAVHDGGTITVALADDPDMLDPTLARTLVGRMVFISMCEKLYDIDQKLNVVPQLAASPPTISQDGRSAEIKLRQGSGSTTTRRWTPRRSRSPWTGTVPSRAPSARASCWR
jgi:peptide/nickel transport system substrate-binding protein